jgi:hypothetical protein
MYVVQTRQRAVDPWLTVASSIHRDVALRDFFRRANTSVTEDDPSTGSSRMIMETHNG